MAHTHDHADGSYFAEQLSNMVICTLLGGVTILLYSQNLLRFMLVPKFFIYVLLGGITLIALVVVRAFALWSMTGKSTPHTHSHESHNHAGHDHAHTHDHQHHEHGEACAHDHEHDHEHEHAHAHDHGHDHGWNPWRYIVLFLPVALYFLNLPNAGFTATARMNTGDMDQDVGRFVENTGLKVVRDTTKDGIEVVNVVVDSPAAKSGIHAKDLITEIESDTAKKISTKGLSIDSAIKELRGPDGTKLSLMVLRDGEDKPMKMEITRAQDIMKLGFKELDGVAYKPDLRKFFEGRIVQLVGQYQQGSDDRMFGLVRYKMTCCAADAVPLNLVIMLDPQVKESLVGFKANDWVQVTGRVQFRKLKDRDEYVTVLLLGSAGDVKKVPPDDNPYLQS
jgi:hypothetical protein